MKIIFCLLIVFINCQGYDVKTFRYKEGTVSIGNEPTVKVVGLVCLTTVKESSRTFLKYYGMDNSTMTPFFVSGAELKTVGDGSEYTCVEMRLGRQRITGSTGTIKITGSEDKRTIVGKCTSNNIENRVAVSFSSTSFRVKSIYFEPKEAGLRAKDLLGYSVEKFRAVHVVRYAIIGYPYSVDHCRGFLDRFYPVAPGLEPGVIIVAKDGYHCAIADNEGTKFIQSYQWDKKVTEQSIVLLNRYFPGGFIYKRYPNDTSQIFQLEH